MLEEDFCSYEVAKLLKEKGFDEPCIRHWDCDDHSLYGYNDIPISNSELQANEYNGFSAPTHQMAMKWLREKYYIYADPIKQGNYNDCSEYYTWIVARMGIIHRNSSVADKLSYEEAVEAALKYSLENLI